MVDLDGLKENLMQMLGGMKCRLRSPLRNGASYEADTNPYYLKGMYERAMEIGGKW